jgi:hypothetical protein
MLEIMNGCVATVRRNMTRLDGQEIRMDEQNRKTDAELLSERQRRFEEDLVDAYLP